MFEPLVTIPLLLLQATDRTRVVVRNNELWLNSGGQPRMLARPCAGPNSPELLPVDRLRIAAVCHVNPSYAEYVEIDLATGRTLRRLGGFGFANSPDRTMVAHVGWIPHFAPPHAKSHSLQINGKTVYPPSALVTPGRPESFVRLDRGLYRGIHEFKGELVWSPDSRRIAFLERIFDWQPDYPGADTGRESNSRWFLVVLNPKTGTDVQETSGLLADSRIRWIDGYTVEVSGRPPIRFSVQRAL